MGSIPLPALHLQQQEQPDILQKFAQVQGLRNQELQGQNLEQNLQQNQLQTQQMQRDQQDQQTIQQTLAQNPDLGSALPQLAGKISPRTFMGLQKMYQEGTEAALKLSSAQRVEKSAQHDQILGLLSQAKQLPPDQYQQAWPQIAAQAAQIMPELQGHIDPAQPFPQDKLDGLAIGLQTQTQLLAAAEKKSSIARDDAAAANSAAELPGKLARSQQDQKLNAGTSANGITAEQTARLRFEQQRANRADGEGTWQIAEDDKGQPVLYNAKTGSMREAPAGLHAKGSLKPPTPREQDRADLAQNMNENLSQLEDIVKRRPELFGPAAGRLTSLRQMAGTSDPDVAALKAIREFLGQASQGAHGMRSAQHVGRAADSIMAGFVNSPEAMMGAIKAARNSTATFAQDVKREQGSAPQQGGNDPLGLR